MKALKHLLLTSALAAGLTGSAFANTTVIVHIVGAPAFRQPVNDSIETVVESFGSTAGLTATSATGIIPAVGSRTTGSSIEGAKQNQWLIPNFSSGIDLEINASFTGSTAGVESVASQGVQQKFITDADATAADVTTPVNASATVAVTPDVNWITASDTFQASTLFNGTQKFYGLASHGSPFTYTYQTLNSDTGNSGNPPGVEVYHWVASPNAPADFTNITTEQAAALYTQGSLPLSYFTGNSADTETVYALSRDPGSGARTITLAEIGVQPPGTNAYIQTYVPTITGSTGTLDDEGSIVGGTITTEGQQAGQAIPSTGIYEPAGDAGFASFGTSLNGGSTADSSTSSQNIGLLQAITATPPSNTIFVTYLDNDDTNEALAVSTGDGGHYTPPSTGGSAKLLTFNGVAASLSRGTDPVVANGEYTFWSYESFLSPAGQSSTALSFETLVEAQFPTFAALPATSLNVSRSGDGVNQVY
jgi:hypothetical protein